MWKNLCLIYMFFFLAFPHLFCQSSQIPKSVLRKWPFIIRIYLKLDTTKTFPEQCRSGARPYLKHNALQRRAKGQTLSLSFLFLSYPSHIYFIRCILHRLHGGRMVMCSDTHTHTHHRCPLVHVVMLFFSSSPFFHSSGEDNKHQQPDIISIGEDKEYLLMTTNISAVDFCVCN